MLLLAAIPLAACGSGQTDPVAPDPERPTFILFFTDP
jgi:hypothetical protein